MNTEKEDKVNLAIDIAIKLSFIAILVYISFLIIKPFIGIIVWGIILAIAISPLINKLQKYYSNRKVVVILLILFVILILIIPIYMFSDKLIESAQTIISSAQSGIIVLPPANENVKEWPIIGEKIYYYWSSASENITQTLQPFSQDIKSLAGTAISAFGSGIGTILMFIASMIIAAIFLINNESSIHFYKKLLRRLIGDRAEEYLKLSTLTVQSVVTGVIGVAVIQSLLALIGLAVMDIPYSLVLAFLIMFLSIMQVPALIVIGPVIAYVFSQGSGTSEIIFTIYMLLVGASDSILKPILMGRGVDIPMLVILMGAIGGMILIGMIGLFVGAVIFALTYKLLLLWINEL